MFMMGVVKYLVDCLWKHWGVDVISILLWALIVGDLILDFFRASTKVKKCYHTDDVTTSDTTSLFKISCLLSMCDKKRHWISTKFQLNYTLEKKFVWKIIPSLVSYMYNLNDTFNRSHTNKNIEWKTPDYYVDPGA